MTKKEFKSKCSFHEYVGYNGHKIKHNVIYFDHKENGFKYAVALDIKNGTRKELFDALYNWVTKDIVPTWYIRYKFAETDDKRFKVGLSLNF